MELVERYMLKMKEWEYIRYIDYANNLFQKESKKEEIREMFMNYIKDTSKQKSVDVIGLIKYE